MALKVYDLSCEQGHVFEGWFHNDDSYESQRARGLLSCPVCADTTIEKKLAAPRLNVSHLRDAGPTPADMAARQAAWLQQMRVLVKEADNVGTRFAEEARRIHEGDTPARAIRGVATPQEQAELAEDGVAFMPVPGFLDDDRLQ